MIIFLACLLTIGVLVFILSVRAKDLPEPAPVSPFDHLDERKAAIYENLRDLQFEYRVGKLSDRDYQQTKQDLQKELAAVLAEIDRLKQTLASQVAPVAPKAGKKTPQGFICPSCKAEFPTPLKFCGECGKPMKAAQA
jgi:rRNA maturation endonuclease Nob1